MSSRAGIECIRSTDYLWHRDRNLVFGLSEEVFKRARGGRNNLCFPFGHVVMKVSSVMRAIDVVADRV